MNPYDIFQGHAEGIREALDRCNDPTPVAEVAGEIAASRAQVWGNARALIVTQLRHPYVHFWIATGEMKPVVELSRVVLAWAKKLGYTKASLTGRSGWVRALQREGWRQSAVLLEKSIDG